MRPVIVVAGTLDTKGEEHAFVADCLRRYGCQVLLVDFGTGGPPTVKPDISREEVALAGGIDLPAVRARGDRGECVAAMAAAAPQLLKRLHGEGRLHGVISLGGGGGTAIASAAMQALPIGVPKVLVSTLASGNTAPYVGVKDIVLVPAIGDVAGLNRVSREIFARAAGAIWGMVGAVVERTDNRPVIAASMFGNTTACVNAAREMLNAEGYEVLVFHATGTGGRTMESLIEAGAFVGVLDVTTTELIDELVGGVLTAGPDRLNAAARMGIPAVVAPGCLDMVNFGEPATVPAKFRGRKFYQHNPQVTLMRTTPSEAAEGGRVLAEKVNRFRAPVTVLLPRGGISLISEAGGPFHDAAADAALFSAITQGLRPDVPVVDTPYTINDRRFAAACVVALLAALRRTEAGIPVPHPTPTE